MSTPKKAFKALQNLSGPVLVTGHTGFKGMWLTLLLEEIGVEVVGYALEAEPTSLYSELKRHKKSAKRLPIFATWIG